MPSLFALPLVHRTMNDLAYKARNHNPLRVPTRRNPKRIVVSRLVCEIVHGTMDEWQREQARHACDNPPCVNPEHLLPGTPVDNQRDSTERGRRPSFRGELNPNWRHGRNVRPISLPDGT